MRYIAIFVLILSGSELLAQVRQRQPGRGDEQRLLGVTINRDLEYARAGDRSLKLDMYVPASQPGVRRPAILWVHGGGWVAGSKSPCPAAVMALRGYVVASVEYRLAQAAPFPAQIHDCKAAVRWLRANADRYGIDRDHIGAWGASAGGHLVALLGASGGVEELEGDLGNAEQSSRVQAVCDFFGPTDLVKLVEQGGRNVDIAANSPVVRLLGGPVERKRRLAESANPIAYITNDDPPFLIMHGDQDPLVPLSQSRLLHEALEKGGVKSNLYIVKGAGHGFVPSGDMARTIVDFFDRNLKPATSSQPD